MERFNLESNQESKPERSELLIPDTATVLFCAVIGSGLGAIIAGPGGLYIGGVTAAATATGIEIL